MSGTAGKLDAIDLKILETLQREGRISKVRLAERVHLSPSPTWERLRRLEEEGYIAGYHARLDPHKFPGAALILVEVTLKRHHQADFARFEAAVRETPEIVECYATGGGIDYVLKVVAPSVDHYQRLIDSLLEADLGVDRYFSYIVTKPVKTDPSLPLDVLVAKD